MVATKVRESITAQAFAKGAGAVLFFLDMAFYAFLFIRNLPILRNQGTRNNRVVKHGNCQNGNLKFEGAFCGYHSRGNP